MGKKGMVMIMKCVLKNKDISNSGIEYDFDLKRNLVNNLRILYLNRTIASQVIPKQYDEDFQTGNLKITAEFFISNQKKTIKIDPYKELNDEIGKYCYDTKNLHEIMRSEFMMKRHDS